jgi:integrase
MSRKTIPSYRKQRTKNGADRAFVELGGVRHYLGAYGSDESQELYGRAIAEWKTCGGTVPVKDDELTVTELCAAFWQFAKGYYQKPNGETTSEVELFKLAMRPPNRLYGRSRAMDFDPLRLQAVRQEMIDTGWCRTYINRQIVRVRRIWKWGAAQKMVPPSVYHGLQSVPGLKLGRTTARESDPVVPVSDHVVEATLPFLTPTLKAMIGVQRLTGARPGEICMLRTCDLDMLGSVWIFRPKYHKSMHRGRDRQIYIGPKAQEILRPFLRTNIREYVFSPIRSEEERRAAMTEARVTPACCGNRPGSNRKRYPKRGPGDHYRAEAFAKSIYRACLRAFPAPSGLSERDHKAWDRDHSWSPNQIRHAFATEIRREHGLESAQILLGHSKADVTQVYAERDTQRAVAVALKVG